MLICVGVPDAAPVALKLTREGKVAGSIQSADGVEVVAPYVRALGLVPVLGQLELVGGKFDRIIDRQAFALDVSAT